jgi:hypothetical protein
MELLRGHQCQSEVISANLGSCGGCGGCAYVGKQSLHKRQAQMHEALGYWHARRGIRGREQSWHAGAIDEPVAVAIERVEDVAHPMDLCARERRPVSAVLEHKQAQPHIPVKEGLGVLGREEERLKPERAAFGGLPLPSQARMAYDLEHDGALAHLGGRDPDHPLESVLLP